MRFNNFRKGAAWKRKLFTYANWKSRSGSVHFLFELPGLSILNVEPDELHCVHLGTTSYMLGCILWLLCFAMLPGTAKDNMQLVWRLISEAYRESNVDTQFTHLQLGSFCDADSPMMSYPRLKGKGAEVKDLVLPIREVWQRFRRADNRDDALVADMLDDQLRFQDFPAEGHI